MTTRYEYKCDSCGNDYVEQRSDAELTPYFAKCAACGKGTNQEVNKVQIEPDPEPLVLVQEEPQPQ